MTMSIEDVIKKTEALRSEVEKRSKITKKIIDACHNVGKSWSGSSMVGHAKFYYKDFEEPDVHNRFSIEWGLIHGVPEGWEEKDKEKVREN